MSERLRGIILAPHSATLGAVPRIAGWLSQGLNELGWETQVYPWGKRSDAENIAQKLVSRWRDVHEIVGRVREFRPDFVVVKSGLDWKTVSRDNVLVRALRPRVRTIILQPHGGQSERLRGTGDRLFKRGVHSLIDAVDAVFVLSTEERESFEAFRPSTPVMVVMNPYDATCLGDGVRRAEPGRFRVLFVGRLVREKGVLELIDAAANSDGRGELETVIVGDGPLRGEAEARVRAAGLEGTVVLAGEVRGDALADAYRRADVLALPSYTEGFPTVVAEAMGFGLPIVCTPVRGVRDYLVDGTHALFVEVGSWWSLRDALLRMRDNAGLAASMGAANRELVSHFAPHEVARGYRQAIEAVRARGGQQTATRR